MGRPRRRNGDIRKVVQRLKTMCGIRVADTDLIRRALTHSSFSNEHPGTAPEPNERLEFLGDAILGAIIAEQVYLRWPRADEGELSRRRAMLVRERTLAGAAREIGLGEALLLGKGEEMGGGRVKDSVLASAFEALVAAVFFQDGGSAGKGDFEAAKKLVLSSLATALDALDERTPAALSRDYDAKGLLQVEAQARGLAGVKYVVVAEEGPDHDKRYVIGVYSGDRALGRGLGRNKKEAEQEAAREALRTLGVSF